MARQQNERFANLADILEQNRASQPGPSELDYLKKGPLDHATTGRLGYEDRLVSKTETERRPLIAGDHHHHFTTGVVTTDRIPESMNESTLEGVSIAIGKSSAQLGIVGSNPNLGGSKKEDSPNRGAFGTAESKRGAREGTKRDN